jgi:hypothetical protein
MYAIKLSSIPSLISNILIVLGLYPILPELQILRIAQTVQQWLISIREITVVLDVIDGCAYDPGFVLSSSGIARIVRSESLSFPFPSRFFSEHWWRL